MDFRYNEEEERFRQRVRDFIRQNLTVEAVLENVGGVVRGPHARAFVRTMAEAGLVGLSWPKEYGGKDLPPVYDLILTDELAYFSAPQVGHGVGIVGRTLMRHGNEYLKAEFLPKIIREDVEFAIGYSEPDAGSDLAALRLSAIEDGDDYVLNGQKLFCSSAHVAEFVWLLARSDASLPKHKGLSLFLVDLNSQGITIRGLGTLGSDRTNEVFFDHVRVPKKYLVGQPNRGWQYVMEALAFERQILFPTGYLQSRIDHLVDFVKSTSLNGEPLSKDPLVRHKVARLAIDNEVSHMLEMRVGVATNRGHVGDIEAAMHKLFGSHLEQRICDAALSLMGLYGTLQRGSKHAPQDGFFEHLYRFTVIRTIGGGTSETQRNIIARRFLGLPNA